jgi:hypothetical protein
MHDICKLKAIIFINKCLDENVLHKIEDTGLLIKCYIPCM